MKISSIVQLAATYDALLTRYARFITKNDLAASTITLRVFEIYYESNIPLEGKSLRLYLKSRTKRGCDEWLLQNILPAYQN
jgi:hypothetical protein